MIYTQVRTMKKTRRTAKQDFKALATMPTMMLKTMNKGDIPEFTRKALMIAIDSLKKAKSADSKGIKAEDIKGADEESTIMIRDLQEGRRDKTRELQTGLW